MQTAEEAVFLPHPAGCFAASCREGLSPWGQKQSWQERAGRSGASPRLCFRHLERRSGRTSALPYPPSR
jgi:hypothetical protein